MTFNGRGKLGSKHLRLVRAWCLGSTTWWFFFAVLVVALAADLSTLLLWRRGTSQAFALRNQVQSVQAALQWPVRASKSVAESAQIDFVHSLPGAVDAQAALAMVNRSSADAGVALISVQLQSRAETTALLSRTDLLVQARGSYPKLKQVINDVLGRYPNATLNHLNLRRNGPLDQAEATVVIGMWGAPMARSAPGAR